MKKRIAVLLTLVMIFSAFCAVPASADGEDTFHFHTRTAEYSFKVGDTFTYSYWLNLNPSILAELGDYTGIKALYLKKMIGNIMYDTDCLTVIKTEMPQFSSLHSRVFQKNDVLDGIRDTGTMLQAGLLHFNKTCVNTKAEFGAYAWDEKSSSDAVIKENDHSMDQMRYFVRTIMKREVRAYGIK